MNYINLICHRKPERSFFIKGHQFPVCARCTGFYMALTLYFIFAYYSYVNYSFLLILMAISCLIPTVIDGFAQLLGLHESNNLLRFITGFMGGLGLGIIAKAIKWFLFIVFR